MKRPKENDIKDLVSLGVLCLESIVPIPTFDGYNMMPTTGNLILPTATRLC